MKREKDSKISKWEIIGLIIFALVMTCMIMPSSDSMWSAVQAKQSLVTHQHQRIVNDEEVATHQHQVIVNDEEVK
jgi:hypothetical protein